MEFLSVFGCLAGKTTFHLYIQRTNASKGTTINDLGVGPEEIEKKNFWKVHIREKGLPREKNFKRPSPGKNKFQKALPRKK